MSRLPTTASAQGYATLAKIPDNSKAFDVQINGVVDGATSLTGRDAPGMISIRVHQHVEIPYVFMPPRARPGVTPKNTITQPLTNVNPVMLVPGKTYLLQMFNPPKDIVMGALRRLEGVYQDAYMGPRVENGKEMMMTEPLIRLTCTRISPVSENITLAAFDAALSWDERRIHPERDVPGDDRLFNYVTDPPEYFTFIVDVGRPGDIVGRFMPPRAGNKYAAQFEPWDKKKACKKPAVNAITGGRDGDIVEKAQFYVEQSDAATGLSLLFKTFTRVYDHDGLVRFQLPWLTMGEILTTTWIGRAYATIDRAKTKELEVDESVDGVLDVKLALMPDMAATARAIGFPISWEYAQQLDDALKHPGALLGPRIDLDEATAINLLHFYGNAELIPLANERGWVEFYVTTSMQPMDEKRRADLAAMAPEKLVEALKNPYFYPGGQPSLGLFVMTTPICPVPITQLVAARGTPMAALLFQDAKRIKME